MTYPAASRTRSGLMTPRHAELVEKITPFIESLIDDPDALSALQTLGAAAAGHTHTSASDIYAAVKAILAPGTNVSITPNDVAKTLMLASTGGSGSSSGFASTSSKSANYAITAGDGGGVIKCTAAVTLTLPAASGLPVGWWVTISNRVAGAVIFAPAGADTIAGVSAVWSLRSGQDVTVYRTGAGSFDLLNLGQSLLDSQATWSPINKGPSVTLSNNNFTAVCPSGNSVRASAGASSGKKYCEILFDSVGDAGFGVATAAATLSGVPGADANGWGYLGDGRKYSGNVGTAYGSTYTSGAVGRVAHDIDAGKVWVAIGAVWQGGGDPAVGTNPMFTGVSGGTFYPAVGDYNSATTATARFSNSSFAFTPPAGFLPYY